MSSQEQRSNLSTPLVGDIPSPKFMNETEEKIIDGNASSTKIVGSNKPQGYSGPDRFQMPPDINPSGSSSTPHSTPSAAPLCTHHHNHNHHHHHQQHHHRSHGNNCGNHSSYTNTPQHYHSQIHQCNVDGQPPSIDFSGKRISTNSASHYYQQIGGNHAIIH